MREFSNTFITEDLTLFCMLRRLLKLEKRGGKEVHQGKVSTILIVISVILDLKKD